MTDRVVLAAYSRLVLAKRSRPKFADSESHAAFFRAQLQQIPDSIKADVCAQIVFNDARALVVLDLFNERRGVPFAARRHRFASAMNIWFSRGAFRCAHSLLELKPELPNASFQLKVILRWLECAQVLWSGGFGEPHDLAAFLKMERKLGAQREAFALERGQTLPEDSNPLAKLFPPELLGERGGAKNSRESALRGWLIRRLHDLLPPFKAARYSIIAELLSSAGIEGISQQLVRGVILGGKT